jgi:hypothetical protein
MFTFAQLKINFSPKFLYAVLSYSMLAICLPACLQNTHQCENFEDCTVTSCLYVTDGCKPHTAGGEFNAKKVSFG